MEKCINTQVNRMDPSRIEYEANVLFQGAENRAAQCHRPYRMECHIGYASHGIDQRLRVTVRWVFAVNFV